MDEETRRDLGLIARVAALALAFVCVRLASPYFHAIESAIDSYLSGMNWSEPLWDSGPGFLVTLGLSVCVGAVLAVWCHLAFGAFQLWGFCVGTLAGLMLWLTSAILAAKYGALVGVAVAYLIFLLKYVDEAAPVYESELLAAASARSSSLQEFLVSNPEALESVTDSLNVGIEDPNEPKTTARTKALAKVKRNFILGLIGGAAVFLSIAYVI